MSNVPETIRYAMMLAERGQVQDGISSLRALLTAHGNDAELHHSIGLLQFQLGSLDQAAFHFDKARHLDPKRADMHCNYATALNLMGKSADAVEPYRKAVELDARNFAAQLGLSSALFGIQEYSEAIDAAKLACDISPGRAEPWVNLCLALSRSGQSEEAIKTLRRALENIPDQPLLLTNLVQALNHRHDADPKDVFQQHVNLGRSLTAAFGGGIRSFNYDASPERPLRIGYLSTNLKDHAVGHFMASIIASHNRDLYRPHCYSATGQPDAITEQIRSAGGAWTDVSRINDGGIVQQLAADRIDILVDLDGHGPGSRIGVLAMRGAPVQVSWMGYPNTTGLRSVGYRLVDAITDPEGAEAFATEKLVRLDGCYVCYRPSPHAPAVSSSPCAENKFVTFGCFTSAQKIVEPVIETWAAILRGLPGSRLMLKSEAFADTSSADRLRGQFGGMGITGDRIELLGRSPSAAEHLGTYSRIDIALDTFPYNGTSTTCEALDMGVPVITLRGSTHAGRVGASLLSRVGMDSMIAGSTEDYIRIAGELARDQGKLASLRTGLRAKLRNSALCDGPAFIRRLETSYRDMWRTWCSNLLMYT